MTNNQSSHKPSAKSNSPIAKTGQGATLQKRLIKKPLEDILKGREKVLQAARLCFARQGFAGTAIKDIQLASGFSRGNLYHHFKTKDEIVQIIISQNLGLFCDRIDSIVLNVHENKLSFKEFVQLLSGFAEEITKGPGNGMAFHVWSLSMVDPEIRQLTKIYFERIRTALEQKIISLQSRGKIPQDKNSQNLSVTLFGIVIPGFTLQSVFMDEKKISSNIYADCLSTLFHDLS
jgi:AcrR family transcriptional regulator